MFTRNDSRAAAMMAAAAVAGLFAAAPAAAQVGAIGGAPGAVAAGSDATASAPVFSESAYVMPKGSWAAGAFAGITSGGFEDGFTSGTDFSFTQFLLGAFYAPSDRLTVGVSVFPYASVSLDNPDLGTADESGRGDASVYAKYQLASSGNTSVAGVASVGLPIGDDNFGAAGASFGLGGVVSHTANRMSLHGSLGFNMPTDDEDGNSVIDFNAALMYAAQDNFTLGVELLGSSTTFDGFDGSSERYTTIDLGPGARFRASERLFLDAGLLFNLSTSIGESPFDYGFVFGATLTR